MKLNKWNVCAAVAAMTTVASAGIVTFDAKNTGPGNYYRPTTHGNHAWTDGGASFSLSVFTNSWGSSWAGFTYSDVNNPGVGGFGNEYAVYGDGLDYSNGGVYAVGYVDGFNGVSPTLSFGTASTVNSLRVNNTAYTALDMINGSGFSKKFGGVAGDDADWLKLTIEGFDAASASQGVVDFYLADYRFADNGQDYIVDDWAEVNLTSLGGDVSALTFSLSSSDSSAWGMNTPSYFAIDQVDVIPEPGTVMLMLLGSVGMIAFRKKCRYFCG